MTDLLPPHQPRPAWLRRRIPPGSAAEKVRRLIAENRLHTVCQAAHCPNIWECFSHGTATFLILGDRCSRNCRFCAVAKGSGQSPPDPQEPSRVADAAAILGLAHVVITSVTRDDLADGGAGQFRRTIAAIGRRLPAATTEVLVPDFKGDLSAVKTVLAARPDVFSHNIETVPRLYPSARPKADYRQSLEVLAFAARNRPAIPVKSGIMLGLGETDAEIAATLKDLRRSNCRILTLGQYLQPGPENLPAARYVSPAAFDRWRQLALSLGFTRVASGPLVRSSYRAEEMLSQPARPKH